MSGLVSRAFPAPTEGAEAGRTSAPQSRMAASWKTTIGASPKFAVPSVRKLVTKSCDPEASRCLDQGTRLDAWLDRSVL